MKYDLTVNRLIKILTEIKEAGFGENLVVNALEKNGCPMPISGIRESKIVHENTSDIFDHDENAVGTSVIVLEQPQFVPIGWFTFSNGNS